MFVVNSLENFQSTSFTTLCKYRAQQSSAYACSKSFMYSIRGYSCIKIFNKPTF